MVATFVLLSGCLGADNSETDDDARSGVKLADYSDCNYSYPNGSHVDCGQDISGSPQAVDLTGFVCLEETDGGKRGEWDTRVVRLLTNYEGDYFVEYEIEPSRPESSFEARARLSVGNFEETKRIEGESYAGVLFETGQTEEEIVEYELFVHAFSSSGEPPVLAGHSVRMHVTSFNQSDWFVWAFQGEGDLAYYFQSMVKIENDGAVRWIPSSFQESGNDFEISATADRPISFASSAVVPDPVDRLVNEDPC